MIRMMLAAFFIAGAAVPALAQDNEELKKRILERVSKKLAEERAEFLKRVKQIIDEEFAKKRATPPAAKTPAAKKPQKDSDREARALAEKRDIAKSEREKAERLKADADLRKEAKEKGPSNAQQAAEMFRAGLRFHEAKKFDQSIKLFKMIYYQYPETQIGFISAYNVACGYALDAKKANALDWLEISIDKGYDDFEHMRQDPDLDGLRKEKRYQRLLADR